ncbi:M48 family metallopeptidase [Actinoplanes sp. NBRC 101535]|uniref:M48 family metallopeptidase n=1 Tax=Actinoplanes sp. NBRC 101535 TaxID=3032196 RepID=UPI002553135A|nr:M48 family metallopeptidase [Actinoplanes sp. NBRC 101535]
MPEDDLCPRCSTATVSERSAEPWCPSCEEGLDRFGDHGRHLGWVWTDRLLYRAAYRLTARQFTAMAGRPASASPVSAARIVTVGVSVLLLAGVLAMAGAGLWLLLYDFFSPVNLIGALLLVTAVVLRPRLGRLSALTADAWEVDRDGAPELFTVIERVSAVVGVPMPDVVLVGAEQNAYTTTVGLRRRRVLCLGAPLWAVLDPQERVALLGHELGHFVNGDVRRGLLTQAATTTLGRVAYLLSPERGVTLLEQIVELICWMLSRLVMGVHLVLVATSQRDSQRAEYLADELGVRAGGSAAAVRLNDHFLIMDAIDTVIRREARAQHGAPEWRAASDIARANLVPRVPAMRQLSRRVEASFFASHPPTGLRAALIETRPAQPAGVELSGPESARIDGELTAIYEKARRELAVSP